MEGDLQSLIRSSSLKGLGLFAFLCRKAAGPVKKDRRRHISIPSTCKAGDDTIENLETWLTKQGVTIGSQHSIRVVHDQYGGLGVAACTHIGVGTLLMTISPKIQLSKEQALISEIGGFIKAALREIQRRLRGVLDFDTESPSADAAAGAEAPPPFDVECPYRSPGEPAVALLLLSEAAKGDASWLRPYLDALPSPAAA